MERQGVILTDSTDLKIDSLLDITPHLDSSINVPELSFELETFDFLIPQPEPESRELKIIIRGKRIWWKPWRRRPDKEYYFPKVDVTTTNGVDYTFKISEGNK